MGDELTIDREDIDESVRYTSLIFDNDRLKPELIKSIGSNFSHGRLSWLTNRKVQKYIKQLLAPTDKPPVYEMRFTGDDSLDERIISMIYGEDTLDSWRHISPIYRRRKKERATSELSEITHPLNVAFYNKIFGLGPEGVECGLDHDLLEDTCPKLKKLYEEYLKFSEAVDKDIVNTILILTNTYQIILNEIDYSTIRVRLEHKDIEGRENISFRLKELLNGTIAKRWDFIREKIMHLKEYVDSYPKGDDLSMGQLERDGYNLYIDDLVDIAKKNEYYKAIILTTKNSDFLHNIRTVDPSTRSRFEHTLKGATRFIGKEAEILQDDLRKGHVDARIYISLRVLYTQLNDTIDNLLHGRAFPDSSFYPIREICQKHKDELNRITKQYHELFLSGNIFKQSIKKFTPNLYGL